jgi:hypothetical protein
VETGCSLLNGKLARRVGFLKIHLGQRIERGGERRAAFLPVRVERTVEPGEDEGGRAFRGGKGLRLESARVEERERKRERMGEGVK